MVTRSLPVKALAAASLVALTFAAVSGASAVSTASALVLIAASIVVPAVMFRMSRRGLPATVADLLHSVNSRPGKREGADVRKDVSVVSTIVMVIGPAAWVMLAAQAGDAPDLSHYREFQLGSTVQVISAQTEASPSDIKVLHQRPAVIQELEWRPRTTFVDGVSNRDSVKEAIFSFYNDQLFRIVVGYDRERTEGLTDSDLIEAISSIYGPAALRRPATVVTSPLSSSYAGGEPVIGRWENADHALLLFRSPSQLSVGVVITSKRVESLARAAIVRAVRLDEQEAPQRAAARQKAEASDSRAAMEKARKANKGTFKP